MTRILKLNCCNLFWIGGGWWFPWNYEKIFFLLRLYRGVYVHTHTHTHLYLKYKFLIIEIEWQKFFFKFSLSHFILRRTFFRLIMILSMESCVAVGKKYNCWLQFYIYPIKKESNLLYWKCTIFLIFHSIWRDLFNDRSTTYGSLNVKILFSWGFA